MRLAQLCPRTGGACSAFERRRLRRLLLSQRLRRQVATAHSPNGVQEAPPAPLKVRRILRGALCLWLLLGAPYARGFGLDDVAEKASKLAQESFRDPDKVPDWLIKISYDQWRDIRFRA